MNPFKTEETSNNSNSNVEQGPSSSHPPQEHDDLISVLRNLARSRPPVNATFRLPLILGTPTLQPNTMSAKDQRDRTRAILDEALRIVNEDVEGDDLLPSFTTISRILPDQ